MLNNQQDGVTITPGVHGDRPGLGSVPGVGGQPRERLRGCNRAICSHTGMSAEDRNWAPPANRGSLKSQTQRGRLGRAWRGTGCSKVWETEEEKPERYKQKVRCPVSEARGDCVEERRWSVRRSQAAESLPSRTERSPFALQTAVSQGEGSFSKDEGQDP